MKAVLSPKLKKKTSYVAVILHQFTNQWHYRLIIGIISN